MQHRFLASFFVCPSLFVQGGVRHQGLQCPRAVPLKCWVAEDFLRALFGLGADEEMANAMGQKILQILKEKLLYIRPHIVAVVVW